MSSAEELIKLFGISNQLLEYDLDRIEREYAIDLQRGHSAVIETDESYYPQIDRAIRSEAARMAPFYEIFYSLERTIRGLISESLKRAEGENWWDSGRVPPQVMKGAEDRKQREADSGTTLRSSEPMDYTNFGELGEIIKSNMDVFGQIFLRGPKAIERVTHNLNTLRSPIAHCSPLAEDEILRLRLSVRDWFRLME